MPGQTSLIKMPETLGFTVLQLWAINRTWYNTILL